MNVLYLCSSPNTIKKPRLLNLVSNLIGDDLDLYFITDDDGVKEEEHILKLNLMYDSIVSYFEDNFFSLIFFEHCPQVGSATVLSDHLLSEISDLLEYNGYVILPFSDKNKYSIHMDYDSSKPVTINYLTLLNFLEKYELFEVDFYESNTNQYLIFQKIK